MDYIEAVEAICSDLESSDVGPATRAGLRLALMACSRAGDVDGVWDRLGLDLLAVTEMLRDLPDVAVFCDRPRGDDPRLSATATHLVRTLADHLDRAAAVEGRALADRLNFDAAAVQLRQAVAVVP